MKTCRTIAFALAMLTGMAGIVHADITNPGLAGIAEFTRYQTVLIRDHFDATQTDSGNAGTSSWYTSDTRSTVQGFERLGYYLEITNGTGDTAKTEWVFVTMPDYTGGDISKIGFPNGNVSELKYMFQQSVKDMNVYISADSGKYNIDLLSSATETTYTNAQEKSQTYKSLLGQTGILEIWPSGYSTGVSGSMPEILGSNTGAYDYYDTGGSTGPGHGSYQIHLYDETNTTGQTLLGINHVTSGDLQMGIGHNNTGNGSPDWTFNTSTKDATSKYMAIFVLPYGDDTYFWDGTEGNWTNDDVSHWANSVGTVMTAVPGTASEVFINKGNATMTSGTSATIKSLKVSEIAGLNIASGASLTISENIEDFGAMTLGGELTANGGNINRLTISSNAAKITNSATSAMTITQVNAGAGTALALTGTFEFAPIVGENTNIAGNLTGTANITQNSLGTVTLAGDNSGFSGAYSVQKGTLELLQKSSQIQNLTVQSGATLTLQLGGTNGFTQAEMDTIRAGSVMQTGSYLGVYLPEDVTQNLALTGNYNFAKSGPGTLTVTGTESAGFTGATSVAGGALQLGSNTATGSMGGSFVVQDSAKLIMNLTAETDKTRTLGNAVTGNGTLVVRGGTLQIGSFTPKTGDARLNVDVQIESGARLRFENQISSMNNQNIAIDIASGATLEMNSTWNTGGTPNHSGDTALVYLTSTHQGFITLTGSGTLEKTGTGMSCLMQNALSTSPANALCVELNPGAWFDIQEGMLIKGGWGSMINWTKNYASLNVREGAKFNLWDGASQFDSLTGKGTVMIKPNATETITLGAGNNFGTSDFGVAGGVATFYGKIDRETGTNIHLSKIGTGTQVLAGTNAYGNTVVNAGTLQIGNGEAGTTGTIGNGAVDIKTGGTLSFQSNVDNTITGVLSGVGNLTVNQATRLTLANAANTFTGTLNVQRGTLQVGTDTTSGSLVRNATIRMSEGSRLSYSVIDGEEKSIPIILGSGYTLEKTGAGTLNVVNSITPGRMELRGGTVVCGNMNMLSSGEIQAYEDSKIVMPQSVGTMGWKTTMYRRSNNTSATDAKYATVAPNTTLTMAPAENYPGAEVDLQVYSGILGWAVWNADTKYACLKNAQPLVLDMSGAGNCVTTVNSNAVSTRTYLSEYSTLSYSALVQLTRDMNLEFAGGFDDRTAMFYHIADENGNLVGDAGWTTVAAFGWTSTGTANLTEGYYVFDVRVGDLGGAAISQATYTAKDSISTPDGTYLGRGVREKNGSLTGGQYYALDIDPVTGNLAFQDGSMKIVSLPQTLVFENDHITVDAGKTLTFENTDADLQSVTFRTTIAGEGTTALVNASGTELPYYFEGSTTGGLSVGEKIKFHAKNLSVGGDLTLAAGDTMVLDSNYSNIVVSGEFDGNGATFDVNLTNTKGPFIMAESADLQNSIFNVKYEGEEAVWDVYTLIATDGMENWNNATFNFDFPEGDFRARMIFEDGNYALVLGNSQSLPEPATWAMFLLGAGALMGMRYFRRKANYRGGESQS